MINKLLSIEDLQSFTEDDGNVIYAVGNYLTIDDALGREYELEKIGFDNLSILEYENGVLSAYSPPIVKDDDTKNDSDDISNDTLVLINDEKEEETEKNELAIIESTVYRVQIGAFNVNLSERIFEGVDNVVSFKGNDGLVRLSLIHI